MLSLLNELNTVPWHTTFTEFYKVMLQGPNPNWNSRSNCWYLFTSKARDIPGHLGTENFTAHKVVPQNHLQPLITTFPHLLHNANLGIWQLTGLLLSLNLGIPLHLKSQNKIQQSPPKCPSCYCQGPRAMCQTLKAHNWSEVSQALGAMSYYIHKDT